jgi:GNAT superfamily N-acetyltransferase
MRDGEHDRDAMSDLVTLRERRASDLNFIRSSWLKSAAALCPLPAIARPAFYAVHWDVVHGLLERADTRLVIACAREHEDQILGYACAAPEIQAFHWAYVKAPFRGQGIARALVHAALDGASKGGIVATHTFPAALVARLAPRGWEFRPHLAFYLALGRDKTTEAA